MLQRPDHSHKKAQEEQEQWMPLFAPALYLWLQLLFVTLVFLVAMFQRETLRRHCASQRINGWTIHMRLNQVQDFGGMKRF